MTPRVADEVPPGYFIFCDKLPKSTASPVDEMLIYSMVSPPLAGDPPATIPRAPG